MGALVSGDIRFAVHGPDRASDLVAASVFADKLKRLVLALRAADRAANGANTHDYAIAKLSSSTPTVTLKEFRLPKFESHSFTRSAVPVLHECISSIILGEKSAVADLGDCAKQIVKLSAGSQVSYGYAELWIGDKGEPIRVDGFLESRAKLATELAPLTIEFTKEGAWFKGVVNASFDGFVKEVDLRGSLPELKLILTAGGEQIDCVCRNIDFEVIRSALNRRVRMFGRAIYDGSTGLPQRLEAFRIDIIKIDQGFERWAGSFSPFEVDVWEDQ